ncbi:nucleic acid-binding protein [Extibacter muris]|uniref:Nucleic acid-binding protein n=2 Tax=Extibacter muris TaxID=1796622 RepID=A0A4R4FL20_9FIRM|nr:nucleic acid-binding protein [Extibacter muris]
MRKCLRCTVEMVEGLDIKVEGGAYGIKVTQQGVFKDNLGKFKCAVCPECGYTETYIENPERVKKLIVDKK